MYAIIVSGGKQHRVSQGDIIEVERLDAAVGQKIDLKVIFKNDDKTISTEESVAKAEVLVHGKAKKIMVFKYKPKKNIRKKQGHRQQFSKIKILSI